MMTAGGGEKDVGGNRITRDNEDRKGNKDCWRKGETLEEGFENSKNQSTITLSICLKAYRSRRTSKPRIQNEGVKPILDFLASESIRLRNFLCRQTPPTPSVNG
ncbi:hypothetical protein TorRG33x02_225420 [Trema orientale]|uniref:Uncharacterized protein n=1 Tax=Trema orientale TaxID=63057 RepID=A0A2P5E7X5_TREOI|nr:hypothetical protein TorRG33x02_225420 [Trema orientale]